MSADVTLCIPAWQAEPFIDRTLRCARAQTHAALRILVSIDRCDDGTEAICRRHAAEDARVDVVVQPRRLGWADNCNAALDRVDSEFYALYFHDDVIEPDFVRRLRAELLAAPEAIAAFCDVEEFGTHEARNRGRSYAGDAVERIAQVLAPARGAPLRALTRRRALAAGVRFPDLPGHGFWRWYPYLVALTAAGPLRHVPEVLYRRWIRADGLTAGWHAQTAAMLREGVRGSARTSLDTIAAVTADAGERALLRHALALFVLCQARNVEMQQAAPELLQAADLGDEFAGDLAIPDLARLPEPVQAGLEQMRRQLQAFADLHASRLAAAADAP